MIPTSPSWGSIAKGRAYPMLKKSLSVDVAIVGGGLTGILSAYALSQAGKRVAVFEKGKIGSGATFATTGFITHAIDTSTEDLQSMYGTRGARLVWESGAAAIDYIESIVKNEGIECEFTRVPAIIFARTERKCKDLQKEFRAIKKLGFDARYEEMSALPFSSAGYLELPRQAKFHPLKFLKRLAALLVQNGVKIFEETEIIRVVESDRMILTTFREPVMADDVIIATHYPLHNPIQTFLKKAMYKSYVYEIEVARGALPECIAWDNENPYNYFRVDAGRKSDRIIFGGADHRSDINVNPKKSFAALKDYMDATLGNIPYTITRKWTGSILESIDGLPLIGRIQPHEYVATAFSGNGMTYAAVTAMMLSHAITEKKNSWKRIYDPRRIPTLHQLMKKGSDYMGELAGGVIKNTLRRKQSSKRSNTNA